jgi:polysaccharide biosynthesis transport protein
MQPSNESLLPVRTNQNQPAPQVVYLEPMDGLGSEPSETSGLLEYWHLLRFRKWTVIAITLVGMVTTAAITFRETPIYQARTTIEIQGIPENLSSIRLGAQDGGGGTLTAESYIQTQARVLQSRSLRTNVNAHLISKPHDWSNHPPDHLTAWAKVLGIPLAPSEENGRAALPMVDLKVRVVDNTRMIELLCDSPDPRLSADFANSLIREYVDSGMAARWEAAQRNSQWLTKQLAELKDKLQSAEKDLQTYRASAGLLLTSDKQDVRMESLLKLQDELARAQAERMSKQSIYEVAGTGPVEALPQVMDNDRLSGYQSKLADLRRELADLSAQLTPEHYKVKRVQLQINELEATLKRERESVMQRVGNDYKTAERRERLLLSAFSAQAALVADKNSKAFYNDIITQEVTSLRQFYDELLKKLKEVAIASTISSNLVRVVDAAEPPDSPYKPDLIRNFLMGLAGSLALALAFVFSGDYVNRKLKAPGETPFHLRVPELGVIPEQRSVMNGMGGGRKGTISLWNPSHETNSLKERVELVTWQDRPSIMAESFRSTLASILVGGRLRRRPRVILMTSPSRGDGKSTAACNVSLALAEINQKVLLIDADMRKPQLHNIFGLPNNWGLSDLLRERTAIADAPMQALVRETEIQGLSIVPSGPGTASISNLLYSDRMSELLQRFRKEFDTVIIDTPPMLYVADARVLGRLADAAILVLRAGKTTRDEALRSKQRLMEDDIDLLGTILNGWDLKSKTRYGYTSYASYGANEAS